MGWIVAGLGLPLMGWLVLHFAQAATRERERADYNEAAAKEIKKQADNLVERRTDADVVGSLRSKAADKRKRDADGHG